MVVSSVSAVGVNVPVHVLPVLIDIAASEPLAQETSALLAKAATVSEKTMVRVAVSPSIRVVSDMLMLVTDGACVSTA